MVDLGKPDGNVKIGIELPEEIRSLVISVMVQYKVVYCPLSIESSLRRCLP